MFNGVVRLVIGVGKGLSKTGVKIAGLECMLAGLIITAIGLYAASGGFSATVWEIMGRVMPPSEWSWYLSIIGIVVLLIGAIVTYFGFKKK